MRHLALLLLLLAAAMLRLDAQRDIAPSLRSYAANWSPQLKSLFETAGFNLAEVNALPATMPSSQTRNQLLLDSTIRFVDYPDSMPFTHTGYTYPQAMVAVATESEYLGGEWEPLTRTTTVKDELGRDVDIFAQRYDPHLGDYVPDSRLVIFPRGDSPEQIDSFIVWAWEAELGDYTRYIATSYVYDDNERIIEEITSIEFFEFPFYFRDYYTYTKEGLLVTILSYNDDGETQLPAGMRAFEYIGQTLVAEMDLLSDGLDGFIPQTRWEYVYTGNGRQDTVTTHNWDPEKETWREVRTDDFDYDAEDRLEAKTSFFIDEEGTGQRERLTYGYAKDEYLAFAAIWAWDHDLSDWRQQECTWYYYEDLLSATPIPQPVDQALFLWPNPTFGQVHFQLAGTQNSVYVYTISGQLIQQVNLAPGDTTVDLSRLPAGMYQVRARSDDEYYSGRLIIQ